MRTSCDYRHVHRVSLPDPDATLITGMVQRGCGQHVVIQSAGHGYRIKANIMKKTFESGGVLQQLLLRFSQALLLQTEQSAVEHRQTIDQQLCRFLLMSLDRSLGNSLSMTHDFVANMLEVRRESVT